MRRFEIIFVLSAMLFSSVPAMAMFTGETKLACEAVLCLSSGKRPKECRPAIKHYFSISATKLSKTLKARRNFLRMCPAATQDAKMAALTDAISDGAGRCDYAALNSQLLVLRFGKEECGYIKNHLPSYCAAYSDNAYADIKAPVYVGVPQKGGFWVDADNYDEALIEYNRKSAAEAAQYELCLRS